MKEYDPMQHFEDTVNNGPEARGPEYVHSMHVTEREDGKAVFCIMKRIQLPDGKSISVQASEHTYCLPRNNQGPYTHVEVGYPEGISLPESWEEYADCHGDNDDDWRYSAVFGYVPVELVRQVIEENS